MRQELQEVVHPVHAPAHPHRHAAVPVSVLRQAVPPEVGHEEAHVHPHRQEEAPQGGEELRHVEEVRLFSN